MRTGSYHAWYTTPPGMWHDTIWCWRVFPGMSTEWLKSQLQAKMVVVHPVEQVPPLHVMAFASWNSVNKRIDTRRTRTYVSDIFMFTFTLNFTKMSPLKQPASGQSRVDSIWGYVGRSQLDTANAGFQKPMKGRRSSNCWNTWGGPGFTMNQTAAS